MSNGGIELDEEAINNLRSDYKQHLSARPQNGRNGAKQGGHKGAQSRAGKNQGRVAHSQRQQKSAGKHN